MNRDQLESFVRKVVNENLGVDSASAAGDEGAPRSFAAEEDVLDAREAGVLVVCPDAIVTPLARETAERLGVELLEREEAEAGSPDGPVVALGADHGGVALKDALRGFLEGEGWNVLDLGTHGTDPVDYPDFAHKVAEAVAHGAARFGVIVDGVGVGSCMAANKHRGVRAALGAGILEVTNAREHNDANVLCLGGRTIGDMQAKAVLRVFLTTEHAGGRHARRVEKIEQG